MARWIVAGLIVLNLMLGVGVFFRMERKAQAQIGHKVGNYATVSGQAGNDAVIYILEVDSGKLVALRNDVVNSKVTPIASRNVADDLRRLFK